MGGGKGLARNKGQVWCVTVEPLFSSQLAGEHKQFSSKLVYNCFLGMRVLRRRNCWKRGFLSSPPT